MKFKNIISTIFLLLAVMSFAQNTINVMSFNIRLATADDGENHWNIRKDKVKSLINY